ncbi:RNA-directed DNA polymerase, eukaryota, reverse transcriptase zinc-binding domain protein [Tanacetum coccineum]
MLAPSGGGLILYQAYGNLYAMTVARDDVAGIKRHRRDLSSDSVRNLATASGHGRLEEDLESSTWRRRLDYKGESSGKKNDCDEVHVDLGNKLGDDSLEKVHKETVNKENSEELSPCVSESMVGPCKSPTNSSQKECVDKTEHDNLPLWVKLCNIPLEAWIVNGVSALASRIGRPLIMDVVIYQSENTVHVKYDWMPFVCPDYNVFGHSKKRCPKKIKDHNDDINKEKNQGVKAYDFIEVVYKRNVNQQVNKKFNPTQKSNVTGGMNGKTVYEPITDKNDKGEVKEKEKKSEPVNRKGKFMKPGDAIGIKVMEKTREKVDSFIKMKKQPTGEEIGVERREMWKDFNSHKLIVNGRPWAIGGDFIVTLNVNEHFAGSSYITSDLKEFKECVNQLEVEDLCSSGLYFTWTKNLLQIKRGDLYGILKKLNRIMVNDAFVEN